MGGQQEEQIELLQRQVETGAVQEHDMTGGVERHRAGLRDLLDDLAVAAQQRLHPHHQFGALEGLHQIVVSSGREGLGLVAELSLGGQHQQRQFGVVAPGGRRERHSVQMGHHGVHHAQVDSGLTQHPQRLPAVPGGDGLQPRPGQQRLDEFPDVRVVVDHQHRAHEPSLLGETTCAR